MMVMLFASSAAIQCPVGTSTSSSLSTDLGKKIRFALIKIMLLY